MGPSPSRPRPSPPPYCDPNGNTNINSLKQNINDITNTIPNKKDYIVNVAGQISDNVNNYLAMINECKERIRQYTKERGELIKERTSSIIILNQKIKEYNDKLTTLLQNLNYERAQNFSINELLKEIGDTSYQNSVFHKSIIATTDQYHDAVHSENIRLNNNINPTNEEYSTDDSKLFYMTGTKESLRIVNGIIFTIYYALIIILVYFIYNKDINIIVKISLIIVLALFPFYITELQDNLRFLYNIAFPRK
jgi:hypothetical protein